MHGENTDAEIDREHRQKRRSDRAERAATRHIGTVDKLLIRDMVRLTDLADDPDRLRVGRVALGIA